MRTNTTETLKNLIEYRSIPVPESGCWLWDGATGRRDYGAVKFRGKQCPAHRASYEVFRGPIPAGMYVCHHCDVPCCVNPTHLFLGTHRENMEDRNRKGRQTHGAAHYKTRLNAAAVTDIRTKRMRVMEYARLYGVHSSSIWYIQTGRSWKHVPCP